jgi:hypothetical protein
VTKAQYLLSILLIFVTLGAAGYWWQHHEGESGPAIGALPPAQAFGFVALPGLPHAWQALRQTKFYAQVSTPNFWQAALGSDGFRRLVERLQHWEQQWGISLNEPTLDLALSREIGLALVPGPGGSWPVDLIAYVRVSDAEKVVESLARTFASTNQDLVRDTQRVDDIEIITVQPKRASDSLSYAFIGSLAVLSTHPRWIVDAIGAHRGTAGERLHTLPLMQEMQLDKTDSLLAYGYYDAAKMPAQFVAAWLKTAQTEPSTPVLMLQTAGKLTMKATRAIDGLKVDTLVTYPSDGTPQMWRNPARDGAAPPYGGGPAETFSLVHLDLPNPQGLWPWVKQMAAAASPHGLTRHLDDFRAWAGVDLERDVLPVMTGVISLGMTRPLGPQAGGPIALPGLFVRLGVSDEAKARQLIQRIGNYAGGPFFSMFMQRLPYAGDEIWYLGAPLLSIKPGYVISRKQLLVGSDLGLLQHMLNAAQGLAPTLADTQAYKDLRRHFRHEGDSLTFINVTTLLEKAKEWWIRLRFLAQTMTPFNPQIPAPDPLNADHWRLLELLQPIRSVGAMSHGDAQGVRTEMFITLEDLKEGM